MPAGRWPHWILLPSMHAMAAAMRDALQRRGCAARAAGCA
jgi:uncharacterized protein YqcC (DUF446 family)